MQDGRVTLRDAAIRLGVSEGAIRKRVARGTLRSDVGDDGRRYVYLDAGTDGGTDASYTHESGALKSDRDELVAELRDRIAYLERQVEEERDARRRADTLLARLMDNIPALESAPGESAPAEDPLRTPQTAAETPPGPRPRPGAENGSEGVSEPRSWWRRVFGS